MLADWFDWLKHDAVVYFATVTPTGEPRVRPVVIAHLDRPRIYFFTAAFKQMFRDLQATPKVEINYMPKENFSIRIRGAVIFEEDAGKVAENLDLNKGIKHMYKNRAHLLRLCYGEHGEAILFDITTGKTKVSREKF